ncbi:helix-turn-helix domain-containing protein [Mesorhizobium sp. M0614]
MRRAAGKAQAEIASVLKIKQPSVSKIEKQADMYLSTLKSCVEAIGGNSNSSFAFPRSRNALTLANCRPDRTTL